MGRLHNTVQYMDREIQFFLLTDVNLLFWMRI